LTLVCHTLAKNIVKNYGNYYKPKRDQWPITQSAIDLEKIPKLVGSINKLGESLSSILPEKIIDISDIRESVQSYAPQYDYDDYIDIGDWADLVANNIDDQEVKSDAKEVSTNLKDTILGEIHYGSSVENSYGLTIWLPETLDKYHRHKMVYRDLSMTKKYPGWDKFLSQYHSQNRIR
jgi:hypothetical protein